MAWREYLEAPAGLLEEIIEARHYAICKAQFDAADTAEAQRRLPDSELMTMAKLITFEVAQEALQAASGA